MQFAQIESLLFERRFLVALLLSIAVELPLLIGLLRTLYPRDYQELRLRDIIAVGILSSSCTLPYLWFVFPSFLHADQYLLEGELIVILLEAVIFSVLLKLGPIRGGILSVLCNLASFFVGSLLKLYI